MQNTQDWNINKGFGDLLTGLIDDVNQAAKTGDTKLWFNSLRILYRNIAGHKKVNAKEIKLIDTALKDIAKKLEPQEAITPTGKAFNSQKESQAKERLDDINVKLITEMHKAGLILPVMRKRPEYAGMEV